MTIMPPKKLLPWLKMGEGGEHTLKKGSPPGLEKDLAEFNKKYAKAKEEMFRDLPPQKNQ